MRDNNLKERPKSPCSVKNTPVPELVICPECGCEMELWSDEEEALCTVCGHKVLNRVSAIH